MNEQVFARATGGISMRRRTWIGIFAVCGLLLGIIGFGWASFAGGDLQETWVSETSRSNEVNHHAVGVDPTGNVIVAPIAATPGSENLTNTSCTLARLAPENGTVLWRTTLPPADCFTHALTQPAIADIDGDDALEVASATTQAALVVYDANTGTEQFRAPLSTYGYGQPTIANVTPAPGRELVVSDINGEVIAVEDGRVAWRVRLNETINRSYATVWDPPIVRDLDGDGQPEIAVGTSSGPVVLNATGGVEWATKGDSSRIAVAQADDDSALELFTAGTDGVRTRDGATGRIEWNRSLTNSRIHTATDADSDGTVELFVSQPGGTIHAVNADTGTTEWTTSIASASEDVITPAPVVGDVNGDGKPETIAVTETGIVSVLNSSTGTELAAYKRTVPIWTVPTPADIDDDGREELLIRYGDGRVVAVEYRADGSINVS